MAACLLLTSVLLDAASCHYDFAGDAINMNDVTRSCLKVYQNILDEGMQLGGPDVWPAVYMIAMFMTHA
jgi:hypothetical protein